LTYCNVHLAFMRTVAHACLQPRSPSCRPRPHDLRHTFAVNTLLDAYRHDAGEDEHVQARLALLCTYLGHVNPGSTYWYLQAAPELLALAGQRLESFEAGVR
jgi:integrase